MNTNFLAMTDSEKTFFKWKPICYNIKLPTLYNKWTGDAGLLWYTSLHFLVLLDTSCILYHILNAIQKPRKYLRRQGTECPYLVKKRNHCTGKIYSWLFLYRTSEHCLVRNHCIAIRNEFHFYKMHSFCMMQFLNFDHLLYSRYKCTQTGKIYPTGLDSVAIKYLYTVVASIYKSRLRIDLWGVSFQKRAYYEKIVDVFYLLNRYLLSFSVLSYSWQMSSINISSENDGF